MLDKRKTSIEIDDSDEYVTFKDLMQASSDCVKINHINQKLVKYLDVPWRKFFCVNP